MTDEERVKILDYPDCCIGCEYAYKNEALQIDCALLSGKPPVNCHLNKELIEQEEARVKMVREKIAEKLFWTDNIDDNQWGDVSSSIKDCYYFKVDELLALTDSEGNPLLVLPSPEQRPPASPFEHDSEQDIGWNEAMKYILFGGENYVRIIPREIVEKK